MVGNNQIEQRIERLLGLLHRNLRQTLALHRFQLAIDYRPNQNTRSTAATQVNVFPVPGVGRNFFFEALANAHVVQTRQHLFGATLERPRRQAGAERSAAGDVGIDVGGDVETGGAGALNLRQHFRHAAPILFVRRLQVPDLDGNLRPTRDLEDFLERFVEGVGFAALMGGVDAAVLVGHLREFHDLFGFRKTCRDVLQRS